MNEIIGECCSIEMRTEFIVSNMAAWRGQKIQQVIPRIVG